MRSSAGQALSLLRDRGPMSRAELARVIGISAPALTNLAALLLSNGSIQEDPGVASSGVGRPANLLSLVPDNAYIIGVHLGAGRLGVVIADTMLKVCARDVSPFDLDGTSPDELVGSAASTVNRLLQSSGIPRGKVRGIGVGVPGRVDASGRFNLSSVFSRDEGGVPFADRLEEQLGMPVVLSHNVTAMALAEALYGAGRGHRAVLNLYLRRGFGAGLVNVSEGGAIRTSAVEIGHVRVRANGRRCHCGGAGCLETVLSEQALLQQLGLGAVPAEGLIQPAMQAPVIWPQIYADFIDVLAVAVTLLEPDLILLSGHLGEAPQALLDDMRRDLPARVIPPFRNVKIERAVLQPDAGALGAACIGLERFVYQG